MARSAAWSPALGTMVVASTLVVPAGQTLTLLPGAIVLVTNGASIVAATGGAIEAAGAAGHPAIGAPLQAGVIWRELSAQGTGASITLRYADISGGQTTVYSNAVALFEDSYFHDYRNPSGTLFTSPLMLSSLAASTEVRRCHFSEYY